MDRGYNGGLTAFALIILTALDGSPIWVESTQIQIIRPATKQCHTDIGAGIRVGTVAICVRETPEQIQKRMRDAK